MRDFFKKLLAASEDRKISLNDRLSARMILVSVPLAYALVKLTTLGPATIFALVHCADLIKCLIGFILIKKGVWLRNIVRE